MKHIKFIFLSLAGFIFFLMPIEINNESKIMISHIVDVVNNYLFDPFILMTIIMAWFVLIMTLLFTVISTKNQWINDLFKASPLNVFLRVSGSFLYLMSLASHKYN